MAIGKYKQTPIAAVLGIKLQTMNDMVRRCKADRDFAIPVYHAPVIAYLAGVPRSAVRPDAYVDDESVVKACKKLVAA